MESPQTDKIRIEIKKTIIDLRLDKRGHLKNTFLPLIDKHLGRKVNYNALNMALSGIRNDNASVTILKAFQEVLQSMLPDKAA